MAVSIKSKREIKQSFFEGIRNAKEGCHLHEISNAITAGWYAVKWLSDVWEVESTDRLLAAHYENTVLVNPG